jgi:transcriptional regulator with PAS, ATPase and Fis domain
MKMNKPSSDRRPSSPAPLRPVIAASAAMLDVVRMAERAAASDAKVLLTGESGVGKDIIAHLIHAQSERAAGPFVAVNCAGLTESLLESELFGHEKGSFTGAYKERRGTLEMAHRGTLFLDEVGEMSLRMQALLLRFLESGELQRVGASERRERADVRVIAATNRNLPERVSAGEFREDLLYRLRVIHIHMPPLRDRRDDIRPLVAHFAAARKPPVEFSSGALDLLEKYRWPGNVRELQNVVEQAVWQATTSTVDAAHLPACVHAMETVLKHRERRRQVADDLYEALASGGYSFWEHIHPFFLSRDITRHDIRELVRRGLRTTRGSYRGLLQLFGMTPEDYQRFHNFLAAHDCKVDFREFRTGTPSSSADRRAVLPDIPGRQRSSVPDGDGTRS